MSLTFKYVGLRLIFSFSCILYQQCIPYVLSKKVKVVDFFGFSPASERKEAHAIGREVSSSSGKDRKGTPRSPRHHYNSNSAVGAFKNIPVLWRLRRIKKKVSDDLDFSSLLSTFAFVLIIISLFLYLHISEFKKKRRPKLSLEVGRAGSVSQSVALKSPARQERAEIPVFVFKEYLKHMRTVPTFSSSFDKSPLLFIHVRIHSFWKREEDSLFIISGFPSPAAFLFLALIKSAIFFAPSQIL